MSESESTEITEQEAKLHTSRKRVRHRKKQLYENILKQMEFYFSDANLTKDRFLGELVKNDPYVPIDVFLKFNKIRTMTREINDIAKAMKHSTLLELSEDRLKMRRKTPVLPYDADARTVYVESIPVTASREWLQRVFSDYGTVTYISLPKFKNSHKIKGYGFIEFMKPEDAQKCLNAFTKMGCKLPTCMPPDELSSIKMFSVEDQPETEKNQEEYEPPKKKKKNHHKKPKNLELKLGHHESDTEKTPTPSEENKSIVSDLTPGEEKTINSSLDSVSADIESKDELTSHDEGKTEPNRKKKTRKRSAKERSKAKNSLEPNEAPKGALWGLQVLSKSEWKALRNKYLNLQRKYMKEMKMNLQNKRNTYSAIPEPAEPGEEMEAAINPHEHDSKKPPLEQIPGVFVKEMLPEPCLDVRLTKRTVKSNIHALHVDAKEGQSEIIIRFDSAKAADEYCRNSSKAHVLSGRDEASQWSLAEAARVPRPRGRTRVLQRAAARARAPPAPPAPRAPPAAAPPMPTHTHIRFDE